MKPNPLFLKVAAVAVVAFLLLIVLAHVGDLVDERQARFHEAVASVEQSHAGRQAVLGPVLTTHCIEAWTTEVDDGKSRKRVADKREFTLTSTAGQLTVNATAAMESRYRGLFKVNTYASRLAMSAQWSSLAALRPQREHAGSIITCTAPTVVVAVSDARGIRRAQVTTNGEALPVEAGTKHRSDLRGFHADMRRAPDDLETPLAVDVMLDLSGTAQLAVAPVANEVSMSLSSDWPHPSFGGRFLPVARDVRANGFDARWQLSSLATTAPADFVQGVALCAPLPGDGIEPGVPDGHRTPAAVSARDARRGGCVETFDVSFIDPVNPYSLSDRAIKYGGLFIGLTFLAVAMLEVRGPRRVHPIQYLLVGSALSMFFLLLLSLSEHWAFGVSYAVAASACVALLTLYGRHVLGGWATGLGFGAGLATLYGALYVLLLREQSALLLGTLLLFAVLAAVMMATRRVDWYGLLGPNRSPPSTA